MIRQLAASFLGSAVLCVVPSLTSAQIEVHQQLGSDGQMYVVTATSLVSASGDINSSAYSTPVSPAYNGVGSILITKPSGTFLCTGSLLADGKTVLTAAHCLSGSPTAVTVNFFSPLSSGGMTASYWTQDPSYTGSVVDQHDIAVIRLNTTAPSDVTRYALATSDGENNPFKFAGFGRKGSYGQGTTAGTSGSGLSDRRSGENLFDITMGDSRWNSYWTNMYGAQASNVLFADFDNGTTGYQSNDAMCWIGHFNNLSIGMSECNTDGGLVEALTAPGDSGGPNFVNGQIAGVTSFGLTFGIYNAQTDPYPDIDNFNNSSYGEFAGFADVYYNRSWLTGQLDPLTLGETVDGPFTSAPEPSELVLLATGLLLIGAAMRAGRSARGTH